MIESVEQLKHERPDLVEQFEKMDRESLIKQCYLECIDAINMEERVQTFMNECTDLSKTTYTPEVIKGLVQSHELTLISDFCKNAIEDIEGMNIEEINDYLKSEIAD